MRSRQRGATLRPRNVMSEVEATLAMSVSERFRDGISNILLGDAAGSVWRSGTKPQIADILSRLQSKLAENHVGIA